MSDRVKRRRQGVNLGATKDNPGKTRQEFKDAADINNVLGKWRRQGFVEHVNVKTGIYGDFTSVSSYQEALDRVAAAQDLFFSLPARIRSMCENDPARFPTLLDDPAFVETLAEFNVGVDEPEEGEHTSPDSGSHPQGAPAEPMAGEVSSPAETGSNPEGD